MLASYNNAVDTQQLLIANSANAKPLSQIIRYHYNCNTAAWISNNQLACGYDDGTIEIYELESLKRIRKIRCIHKIRHDLTDGISSLHLQFPFRSEIKRDVLSVVWNEELQVLTSSGNQEVKIWSLGKTDPIHVLKVDSRCEYLVWNADGSGTKEETTRKILIACGLLTGSIVIWYPFGHENPTRNLSGHSTSIVQLLFSPDKRFLASTDIVKKLIIWSTKSWKSIYILPSSEYMMYPYRMTWDALSCKIGISERKGQKQFEVIEYVIDESCCSTCKKTSRNLKRCARCYSLYYCSKECQRSHWPQHKLVCNKIE